jgi:hypothetical protein
LTGCRLAAGKLTAISAEGRLMLARHLLPRILVGAHVYSPKANAIMSTWTDASLLN